MKKQFLTLIATVFMTGSVLIGCDSSAKKVEEARADVQTSKDNVAEANIHLSQVVQDSNNDYQKFKAESEERINTYEQNIADLKVQIAKEKKVGKSNYQKMITNLEEEAATLKQNLKEYKEDGKDSWEAFKIKFNRNMDDLGKSITNFFTADKKK